MQVAFKLFANFVFTDLTNRSSLRILENLLRVYFYTLKDICFAEGGGNLWNYPLKVRLGFIFLFFELFGQFFKFQHQTGKNLQYLSLLLAPTWFMKEFEVALQFQALGFNPALIPFPKFQWFFLHFKGTFHFILR